MSTVSVVIPCYNQTSFLGEAIESVLGQTVSGVEVVVVDDGSDEDVAAVAARYPGVRYIRQETQGVAPARNAGARASRGSHLIFLDSDDRLLPRAAAAGLEVFDEYPETGLVRGHHHHLTADGAIVRREFPPMPKELDYAALLSFSHHIVTPSEAMVRRAAFTAVGGFRKGFDGLEDLDLYLRIARRFPPVRTYEEVVTIYRQHARSMSRNSALMLRGAQKLYAAQRRFVRGDPELERARKAGLRVVTDYYSAELVDQVRVAVREGAVREVATGTLALLRHNPREVKENLGRKLRVMVTGHSDATRGADDVAPDGPGEAP